MSTLSEAERSELLRVISTLATHEPTGSRELLEAITSLVPARLVVIDPSGRFIWINRYARSEILGRSMFEYMPAGSQDDARAAIERVVATGQPSWFAGQGEGVHGPRSHWVSHIAPIKQGDRVIALVSIARDVSEEWEIHEALRDREERLSMVLRAAGMGMWRFEVRSRTVEFDDRACAIYGFTSSRMDSRAFTNEHIHPDERAEVDRRALESAMLGRPYQSQNRIIRTDGVIRWVEITGSPIRDGQGELVAMLGTVSDITDRRELELKALRANRLDAVGQLTAGVAHNFNNLLASIMPALDAIERDVLPRSKSLVHIAARATERAAELVRQLMAFTGRRSTPVRTVVGASTLIARPLELCRSTFDRAIEITSEIAADLPLVRVDAGQVEQAVLNLLLNARDAIADATPAQSTMHVRVAVEPAVSGERASHVAIVVEDGGPGVPDELRERIFEPFFTTKPEGRGTGLGLSTAFAIAREHGGSLEYDHRPGGGARFTLRIPVVRDVPVETPVATPPARAVPHATVLIVDDERLVRDTLSIILGDAGFTIRLAETGSEGLATLAAEPAIDAILLDLNMPGMSWRTLVAAIRRDHPRVCIVAFTGGVTPRDESVDGWLTKPASPEAITDALTAALASRAAR